MLAHEHLPGAFDNDTQRLVLHFQVDTVARKAFGHHRRYFFVLADHDPGQHLHLRNAGAQAREALRQLAAYWPAAEYCEPARLLAQIPQRVGRVVAGLLQALNRWDERPCARGNDDVAGRDRAPADAHFERRDDLRLTGHALHTELLVTLDRIVRLDVLDHAVDAIHHLREIELEHARWRSRTPTTA